MTDEQRLPGQGAVGQRLPGRLRQSTSPSTTGPISVPWAARPHERKPGCSPATSSIARTRASGATPAISSTVLATPAAAAIFSPQEAASAGVKYTHGTLLRIARLQKRSLAGIDSSAATVPAPADWP